jgi:hypothetical protein
VSDPREFAHDALAMETDRLRCARDDGVDDRRRIALMREQDLEAENSAGTRQPDCVAVAYGGTNNSALFSI